MPPSAALRIFCVLHIDVTQPPVLYRPDLTISRARALLEAGLDTPERLSLVEPQEV